MVAILKTDLLIYEFSANGILFADRKEKPAMQEVRYYYGLCRRWI